jgi:hypothetical protein
MDKSRVAHQRSCFELPDEALENRVLDIRWWNAECGAEPREARQSHANPAILYKVQRRLPFWQECQFGGPKDLREARDGDGGRQIGAEVLEALAGERLSAG